MTSLSLDILGMRLFSFNGMVSHKACTTSRADVRKMVPDLAYTMSDIVNGG